MAAGLKVKRADLRTVLDLCNWYMDLPTVQELRSYKRKVDVAAHLLNYFGSTSLSRVDADALEQYRAARKKEGISYNTINLEMQFFSAMFRLASRRRKILADQIPGAFPQIEEHNPRPIITDEQYASLLVAVDQDFADVLIAGYESAMRSGEICGLTARQVRLNVPHISGIDVDYIDLGVFDTKTGARRTVPVSDTLKEVLERRLEGFGPDDRVFSYTGKGGTHRHWTTAFICNRFADTCRKLGIPFGDSEVNKKGERIGIVFHCLRHTRTTKWVEMGFSDEIVRRATGHRTLEAYQQYVKLDPSAVMRLVSEKVYKNRIKTPRTAEILA